MKKYTLIFSLILVSAITACSENKAQESKATKKTNVEEIAEDARAEHYEATKPKNIPAARKQLNQNIEAIGKLLATKDFGPEQLEEIHEVSYSLEAAVDKLGEKQNIDKLDEAVQALHFASENQEEEITRKWFDSLKNARDDFNSNPLQKAESKTEYIIAIKDHKFIPTEIRIPAGKKVKLIVDNQDPTPEEFESHDMSREKIIGGNRKATIFIGPLDPGKYHFFGEFNMDTANGYVIAE